jgi:hypothetical protein
MIPHELGETKQRLRRIERDFLHLHPLHRLTWRDFKVQVRKVRDETTPALIDPALYRGR